MREAVEVRRLHNLVSVTTNVAIAEIISQHDNELGGRCSATVAKVNRNRSKMFHEMRSGGG